MLNMLLDILFPQQACCLCRKAGRYSTRRPWCEECHQTMFTMRSCMSICEKCGKCLEEGEGLCRDCRTNPPDFDIARAVGPYDEPYRIAIKVLKFMGRRQLAVQMGHMMAQVVQAEPRFMPIDLIIPVPVSRANYQQRGFNQTEELGRQIAKELHIKMDAGVLRRIKETPSQRELTREEREKNLLFAFQVKDNIKIYRKNILLVDDVYTTGSTGRECTRTLLDAGAARVSIITWATGRGF